MAEERISISRDALRAELAELELRLIEKLASKVDVDMLRKRVEVLEEKAVRRDGPEFRQVKDQLQKALTPHDVDDAIASTLQKQEARGWTARERWFGVTLFAISVASFVIQLRGF